MHWLQLKLYCLHFKPTYLPTYRLPTYLQATYLQTTDKLKWCWSLCLVKTTFVFICTNLTARKRHLAFASKTGGLCFESQHLQDFLWTSFKNKQYLGLILRVFERWIKLKFNWSFKHIIFSSKKLILILQLGVVPFGQLLFGQFRSHPSCKM